MRRLVQVTLVGVLYATFSPGANTLPTIPVTTRTPLADIVGVVLHTHFRTPFATTLVMVRDATRPGHWFLRDLLERLLVEHGQGQLVVQLEGTVFRGRHTPWSRSLLLVEGFDSMRTVFEQLTLDRFDFTGCYLIVLEDAPVTLATVNRIFHELWVRQIVNVVVAFHITTDRDGPVQLWTYYPFSPGLCRVPKPHLILTWPNDTILYGVNFYPSKNTYFHGCPLRIGTFETRPFTILGAGSGTSVGPVLSGFEGDLLRSIATRLNFAMDIRLTPRGQQWGVAAFENSTGMMRMIYTEEVDLGISCLGVSSERSAMLKAGKVHFTTELVIVVPPGRPYTSIEKLFQPFRAEVWLVALLYVVFGLCTIGALRLVPSRRLQATLRRYIVGRHVHNPILNIVRVILASPLPQTPTGTFPRTLLSLWFFFTVQINLFYQGSLFQYLQRASNHPPMATLADIDRSDAIYYASDSARRFFETSPHRLARLRYFPTVPDSIRAQLSWMGTHPDDGNVAMCTRDHVAYYNRQLPHSGRRLQIARESMALYTVTILYPKRSMLTRSFDEHIERIDSSGLLKYWSSRYGDYQFFASRQQTDRSEPTPISIEHVAGVMEELIVLLVVAVVVFVMEVCWACHIRRRNRER